MTKENGIGYQFDIVENGYEAPELKEFDFSVFNGMQEAILKVEEKYNTLVKEGKYSQDYLNSAKDEALIEILGIKYEYKTKADKQLKELKAIKIKPKSLSQQEKQMVLLTRLNNNIIASELMKTASLDELAQLWEANKDNPDISLMIKMRLGHLQRVLKSNLDKSKASNLKGHIQTYEQDNGSNIDEYLHSLETIEHTLNFIFAQQSVPMNLTKGFDNYVSKTYFEKGLIW